MIVERDVDCGDLYGQKRRELVELARSLDDEQLGATVPATPAWSVHDVVAHVVGIAADLNAGRFGAGDADEWTAAQVRSTRGTSIEQLGAEWEREAPKFEDGLRLLGYGIGSHFVADLLQHTADVRHALGRGRLADDTALMVALDFYLDTFHQALAGAAVGSVAVRARDEEWVLGSGSVVASLSSPRFDVFRCLGGRRSEHQIRAMDWSGDVDAVLGLISPYAVPTTDVDD